MNESEEADPNAGNRGHIKLLNDRYEITEIIDAGAMGAVFKAIDTTSGNIVAIKKTIQMSQNNLLNIRMLYNEAKIYKQLSHPQIMKYYEIFNQEERFYIVLDFVEGASLRKIINTNKLLPMKTAIDYILQLLNILKYIHSEGIVHCDVKPENLLVDQDGTLYLTDFGLAFHTDKIMASILNYQIIGTPPYISPELLQNDIKSIDVRADLFAVGVIFYEMLTGIPPFYDKNENKLISNIICGKYANIEKFSPGISKDVRFVIKKLLSTDKKYRYKSTDDVLLILKNIVDGKSVKQRDKIIYLFQTNNTLRMIILFAIFLLLIMVMLVVVN